MPGPDKNDMGRACAMLNDLTSPSALRTDEEHSRCRRAARNGEKFARFFQCHALTFGKRATDGATAGAWAVNFSGRTQRDAILSGELPFFPRLLEASESAAAAAASAS